MASLKKCRQEQKRLRKLGIRTVIVDDSEACDARHPNRHPMSGNCALRKVVIDGPGDLIVFA